MSRINAVSTNTAAPMRLRQERIDVLSLPVERERMSPACRNNLSCTHVQPLDAQPKWYREEVRAFIVHNHADTAGSYRLP